MVPIPVLCLFLGFRLREFLKSLFLSVWYCPPRAIFVVIPVVIILVVFIVDLVFVPASWSLGTVRMESGAAKATVRISEVT